MAISAAPAPPPAPMSLRAFARRIGVTHPAVRKAIASGRLRQSVGEKSGRPCIADPELAEKEWAAGVSKPSPSSPPSAEVPIIEGEPESLTEAQRRVAMQREKQLELANLQKAGQLIDAEEARRDAFACARAVRDALLNIPDRLAGELAAEPDAHRVHERLDAEIRGALQLLHEALSHGE